MVNKKYRVVIDYEGKPLDRCPDEFTNENEAWKYAKRKIQEITSLSCIQDRNPWYPVFDEKQMRCVLIDDNGYTHMWVEER